MDSFSDRVIHSRKEKKWTQLDLSKALQVNVKNVSRWELDQAKPTIETAAQLAKVLEVSLDFLGGLEDLEATDPLEQLLKRKLKGLSKEQRITLRTILEAF